MEHNTTRRQKSTQGQLNYIVGWSLTPFLSSVSLWNSLPGDFILSDSLNFFKKKEM